MRITDIYTDNVLQEEIISGIADAGLDPEEEITALADAARTSDPVYAFIGMMFTEAHISREYDRLKDGIRDQLAILQDQGMNLRDYLRTEAFDRDPRYHTPDHNDWQYACLKAALWGAANDLYDRVADDN